MNTSMLKQCTIIAVSAMWLMTVMTLVTFAEIPKTIDYSGYLTDADGKPIKESVSITFRMYTSPTGGDALWEEPQIVIPDKGQFSVTLGEVTSIDLPFDQPYYLGIEVAETGEMTPRRQFVSVGYAFRAQNADQIGGISSEDLALQLYNPIIQESTAACTSENEGQLSYDTATKQLHICNGTEWKPIADDPTSGGGGGEPKDTFIWAWNGGATMTGTALGDLEDPNILCTTDFTRPPGYDHYAVLISYVDREFSGNPQVITPPGQDARDIVPPTAQNRPVRSWHPDPNHFIAENWMELWDGYTVSFGWAGLTGIPTTTISYYLDAPGGGDRTEDGQFWWSFSTPQGQAYGDCRLHTYCEGDVCHTYSSRYGGMGSLGRINYFQPSRYVYCDENRASVFCVAYDD